MIIRTGTQWDEKISKRQPEISLTTPEEETNQKIQEKERDSKDTTIAIQRKQQIKKKLYQQVGSKGIKINQPEAK